MRVLRGRKADQFVERLGARAIDFVKIEPRVRRIVADVRRGGDRALRGYAGRWDGLDAKQTLRVPAKQLNQAWHSAEPGFRKALRQSAENIRRFCEQQKPSAWTRTRQGISLGQVVRPLESVGCYVPGGRHPLVSTLLMTVIPAQVAGVKEIRVVSPNPSREVLAAAGMLGANEFFRIGGAQAISALAYGTETVPRVDKIVGPGNAFVTVAKKLVSFDCAIDFLAGPTEAVVMSDSGTPGFIAADLAAQAEHDPDAIAIFITTSARLAAEVAETMETMTRDNETARESIRRRGAALIAPSRTRARDWANRIAPEHITIPAGDLPFIYNAGSIFIGDYSAQAAGDYASGPNHVLPTAGQARFRGGLSVLDFVKLITVQEISSAGLDRIAETVTCLATTEGLRAHAESIAVRCANA
jgi:histidinol dehydrogenase